ncbi:fatty acid hydroxylase domain-containing protein 2 [Zeugodacus cucurbitae]|uniref:Uncharacterized protein C5orf4 n=1 Tax=Zeugodacus cucurbitae TaxID=28588 RepID=A0A0A1X5E8_ZEUCU|nr:fatty acid hydroxylase domain-containing protein 2 [Zeugodacus cucurbitae]
MASNAQNATVSLLQEKWNHFLDIVGDEPERLWVFGTVILIFIIYWLYAAVLTLVDFTKKPHFVSKYKLQPGKNDPVDTNRLLPALRVVLFNQTFVAIPLAYGLYHFVYKYQNTLNVRELPTIQQIVFDLALCCVLEEIIFYYGHRLLHYGALYRYIHKKHHEWTSPIAVVAHYCHPIEHILANTFPIALSLGVVGAHLVTGWIFFAIATYNILSDHAGYAFPWSLISVPFHDYHHATFNYNFGVYGWLDRLHGTYGAYDKSGQIEPSHRPQQQKQE